MFASSALDHGFEPWSGQIENYEIGISCFSAKHAMLYAGTWIPDPLLPHLVPPAIMVWIFVWEYIFEPFIHILQHFVLQLSRSTNFCF
jgi:hypothetical protein